jgi:hypothetical protein
MKFQNIIIYHDQYKDYVTALFFECEGKRYIIMHKGPDAAQAVRTVLGRYTDDPWQFAEEVTSDDSDIEPDVV